jgi:hypothetical protein
VMSRRRQQREPQDRPPAVTEPVDVADGIPDRAAETPVWKYVVVAAVFVGIVSFLVTCLILGAP